MVQNAERMSGLRWLPGRAGIEAVGSKHSGTVLYANLLNRADIFPSIHEV